MAQVLGYGEGLDELFAWIPSLTSEKLLQSVVVEGDLSIMLTD